MFTLTESLSTASQKQGNIVCSLYGLQHCHQTAQKTQPFHSICRMSGGLNAAGILVAQQQKYTYFDQAAFQSYYYFDARIRIKVKKSYPHALEDHTPQPNLYLCCAKMMTKSMTTYTMKMHLSIPLR